MKSDQAYLLDMLDAGRLAVRYLQGSSKEAFLEDVQLQDSAVRRIEIIGEAARRVSVQARAEHPSIPWAEMVGMRNLMIHEYNEVDLEVVWDTVQNDLPRLIAQLEPLVPPPGGPDAADNN